MSGATYPKDQVRVLPVPAVTGVMSEEAPREPVVLVLHQNPHASNLTGLILHVFLPDDKNSGPVEYITVIYGSSHLRSYCCNNSITRRKKGCCGTEPMASLEIPVGTVRRTQAGYARRGSNRRLQPC